MSRFPLKTFQQDAILKRLADGLDCDVEIKFIKKKLDKAQSQ